MPLRFSRLFLAFLATFLISATGKSAGVVAEVPGIRALDRYSFEVRVARPAPRLPYLFATPAISGAVARAAQPLQRYRCAACGFEAQHWFWQCPGCQSWDSYPPIRVEEL